MSRSAARSIVSGSRRRNCYKMTAAEGLDDRVQADPDQRDGRRGTCTDCHGGLDQVVTDGRAGGVDLKTVMDRLGHSQIHTTQKYCTLPDDNAIDAFTRICHRTAPG